MFDLNFAANGQLNLDPKSIQDISDGNVQFTAYVTDSSGATGLRQLRFQLDTIAPTLSAPRIAATDDTGRKNNDGITQRTQPRIEVTAEVGSKLRLTLNNSPLFDAASTGTISTTPAVLPDGSHTLAATASDMAGNVSSITSIPIIIDNQPPSGPTVDLSATSDSGVLGDQQTQFARVTLVGSTEASADILWVQTNTATLVSNQGSFFLNNVALTDGANSITLRATDVAGNTAENTRTITRLASTASTDPVIDWNQATLEAIRLDATTPPEASRILAIVHAAIFDAVNAIDGTPGRFASARSKPGSSAVAAVSAAAHRVLVHEFPAQQAALDAKLAQWLNPITSGPSKSDGVALGETIASAMLELRNRDGYDVFKEYYGGTQAGRWQPTAPMYEVPLLPQWGSVQPFVADASNFALPGPPDLSSQTWAAAFNEAKQLGAAGSTARTADQTESARFWNDGKGTYTPAGHWNQIAAIAATSARSSLAENARTFAALNVGLADAGIAAWDVKYDTGFWRPVTAIRAADSDGNDQTAIDANWTPLLVTPPFPEYISGHSAYSGAASKILSSVFGPNFSFTVGSVTPQNYVRTFTSFEAAATEASRSRIYGGIHYVFSGEDGLTLGRNIGQAVLDAFSSTADTQAPAILIDQVPSATSKNINLTGQILDNLAGLAQATIQIDNGPSAPLSINSQSRFSFTTTFPTDGTADGSHTIRVAATDASGNSSSRSTTLTLDTKAPQITVTSLSSSATLTPSSRLVGTANPTGSKLISLAYSFDSGERMPIIFDSSTGGFDEPLDLSRLATGNRQLNIFAVDQASNASSVTLAVALPAKIPLTIRELSPANGSDDVGVTFRPKVVFSRPIDVATLSSTNFFATDTTGTKLPATVVPSSDGTFAWLFLNGSMPGASTITLSIDGSTIRDADGNQLDAAGSGTAGSLLRSRFTTVSTAKIPNTSITGIVADPGTDLQPMTVDDLRVGPDGVLLTGDDVFVTPIMHAKVYILGLESQFVYTDAQGRFTLTSVPTGNVKLAIDGNTATSAPAGHYFPEMVMDIQIEPGRVNTVMGSMGTREQQTALDTFQGVYLPRLQTNILKPVDSSTTTTIGVTAEASPNLTPEERSLLSIQIPPGSLIGPDGQPLSNAQVGISTVPPELVRDMLPPGLLQHTFDITIQAPGVSNFKTPASIAFPNIFNAAPGTKLNFLSFDHTTGRLDIEGTATVSANGLRVTTDAGTGITHPGWHGLTPPGTQNNTSTTGCNPNPPPQPQPVPVSITPGLVSAIEGNSDFTDMIFDLRAGSSSGGCPPIPVIPRTVVVNILPRLPHAAEAGVDFLAGNSPFVFTMSPGQTEEIRIRVVGDVVDESDESFALELVDAATGLKMGSATGLILDDDCGSGAAVPTISISDTNVTEGDTGTLDALFTISLSHCYSFGVQAAVTTIGDTAQATADFIPTSAFVAFGPNERVKHVRVPIVGDTSSELTEVFKLEFASLPTNATIDKGIGIGTIRDDDPGSVFEVRVELAVELDPFTAEYVSRTGFPPYFDSVEFKVSVHEP